MGLELLDYLGPQYLRFAENAIGNFGVDKDGMSNYGVIRSDDEKAPIVRGFWRENRGLFT